MRAPTRYVAHFDVEYQQGEPEYAGYEDMVPHSLDVPTDDPDEALHAWNRRYAAGGFRAKLVRIEDRDVPAIDPVYAYQTALGNGLLELLKRVAALEARVTELEHQNRP